MLKSLLWTTVAITTASIMPPIARADDAYVCDGGRLVYARPETLEKLKQSDPCIQGYFGLLPTASVAPAPATLAPAAPSAPTAKSAPAAKPAPLKGSTRDAELKPARPKALAAKAPEPAPGTDFRNIRVINAPTPDATLFRHDR